MPTQLAMTWNSRVSFVLTEALTLKKIKLLDVVLEGASAPSGKDDKGFDADVALTTGELGQLVADLIDALGGELQRDALGQATPGAQPATGAAPARAAEAAVSA
jgi:recombination associated protein RdgC